MFSLILTLIIAIFALDRSNTQKLSCSSVVLEEVNKRKEPSHAVHMCRECGRMYSVNESNTVMDNNDIISIDNQVLQPKLNDCYYGSVFEQTRLEEYSPNPSLPNQTNNLIQPEEKILIHDLPKFSDKWEFYPEDRSIDSPEIARPSLETKSADEEDKKMNNKKPSKKSSKNSSLNIVSNIVIIFVGLTIGISLIN